MGMEIKTIGVLTSGGDAPGMNAAIRAVVRTAINKGMRVLGIRRGYSGLLTGDAFEMNLRSVSDIIQRGGTILYTARCPEFTTEEGQDRAVKMCKELGIDGLVVIGGDGYIALHSGIACGALSVLVPEVPYDFQRDIVDKMKKTLKAGKQHFVIIVAEGVGHTQELTKRIEEATGITSRLTVLGYVQRGGVPTARERIMASRLGYRAVELLANGIGNRVVGLQRDEIVDYDIVEALKMVKHFDIDLYKMANVISL